MIRISLGIAGVSLAACSLGQALDSDVHFYATAGLSHNLIFLGSAESRTGRGISFAFGKADPKIKLYGKKEGELIWEANYLETRTDNVTFQYPFHLTRALGILATARYRFPYRAKINFYGDAGFGFQFIDHPNHDLPLCNNTTFNFGVGAEFVQNEKTSIVFGTRVLHQSNEGRKKPNFGQNLMEWYIGFRFKT